MLQLYPANKTETLAFLIAEIIARHPLKACFAEEHILIQSQGMATWLQQEISAQNGVSALIKCEMPASYIWGLAEQLMPEAQHIPVFEKNNARWEIFRRLPEKLEIPCYRQLKHYLLAQNNVGAGGSPEHSISVNLTEEKALFDLSSQIADVFDAYQNYRPDWIQAWEAGSSLSDLPSAAGELEQWQADLWRSLYPEIPITARQHRTALFQQLLERLEGGNDEVRQALPERLFIFGLSALPPHWLPFITALSRHTDIHFMVFNPCKFYWGDVLSPLQQLKLEKALVERGVSPETAADTFLEGNPLLASWGKLGRDYISLLSSSADIQEVSVNLYDDHPDDKALCALHCIQQDILNLQCTQHQVSVTDDSVQFASCHSSLREVEALHDYLLNLLNKHPDLQAKDIIVMMPDVQDFSALIDAVFSRPAYDARGQGHLLPYAISDQSLAQDQPLLDTLSGLLNLSSNRISGIDLLDWLEIPAIRARFDIAEDEIETIKVWIDSLNIRWGLSEAHRDALLHTPGTGKANTWLAAVGRLLAGYLVGQELVVAQGENVHLAFPQRSPEKHVLAGKLMRFLDVIERSISLQNKRLPIASWLKELNQFWHSWFDFEWVSDEIQSVLSRFETELKTEQAYTCFSASLGFPVIATLLNAHIENQRVSQRFLAGRINFCTLMPMRSIPFKVVCMLGLNEGAYPRQIHRQSFDLLTQTPNRIGDRSRRDDDRYLFLEAICSARDHLYISYCGNDVRDNSERYPSILVTELQSYCAEQFVLIGEGGESTHNFLDSRLTRHHLQPFHPGYYFCTQPAEGVSLDERDSSAGLVKSFATEWLPLINPDVTKAMDETPHQHGFSSSPAKQKDTRVIELRQLQSCVSHPLRFYYQTVLQVTLTGVEAALNDAEPFAVNGLDAYSLKKDLLHHWLTVEDFDAQESPLLEHWQLAGKLPRPPLDTLYHATIVSSLESMHEVVKKQVGRQSAVHSFSFNLTPFELCGDLLIHDNQLIELSLSREPDIDFFPFWVKHVCWSMHVAELGVQEPLASYLIGPEKMLCVPVLDATTAREYALELCDFFEAASNKPFVFFPKSTFAWLFGSADKAKKKFEDGYQFPGENSDVYWRRYCAMQTDCVADDWSQVPAIENTVLFQQINAHLEQIEQLEVASLTGKGQPA